VEEELGEREFASAQVHRLLVDDYMTRADGERRRRGLVQQMP
jgi:hypothetical protein